MLSLTPGSRLHSSATKLLQHQLLKTTCRKAASDFLFTVRCPSNSAGGTQALARPHLSLHPASHVLILILIPVLDLSGLPQPIATPGDASPFLAARAPPHLGSLCWAFVTPFWQTSYLRTNFSHTPFSICLRPTFTQSLLGRRNFALFIFYSWCQMQNLTLSIPLINLCAAGLN